MNKEEFFLQMEKGLESINIDYDSDKVYKLWQYMNYMLGENKKYNLTNITDEKNIIKKHFLDSLAPFAKFNILKSSKILDVGTGPGFPGLVLKIFYPEKEFILIDSTLKKVNFLKMLSAQLNIFNNLDIIHGRAEDLGKNNDYRESFDLVLSRAVAPLNILAEYTVPFAVQGGILCYYKGPSYEKEIKNSKQAFIKTGGEFKRVEKINITNMSAERYILLYEKIKITPQKYPRRAGMPKKRPL